MASARKFGESLAVNAMIGTSMPMERMASCAAFFRAINSSSLSRANIRRRFPAPLRARPLGDISSSQRFSAEYCFQSMGMAADKKVLSVRVSQRILRDDVRCCVLSRKYLTFQRVLRALWQGAARREWP